MKKISLYLLLFFCAPNILAHDINWYSQHPEVVQKVIKDCPRKQPKDISCKQLQEIGIQLNELITLFVSDAHDYGQQILDIQQRINSKMQIASLKPEDESLKISILNDKLDMQKRLNIVRWLASP